MDLYHSFDFEPVASPPLPDHNRSRSDRLKAMFEQGYVPHPALVKQALQRLGSDQRHKSNRVDLETAQIVAVFLKSHVFKTKWEDQFLHSVAHYWHHSAKAQADRPQPRRPRRSNAPTATRHAATAAASAAVARALEEIQLIQLVTGNRTPPHPPWVALGGNGGDSPN
jgi:hypothetical protein